MRKHAGSMLYTLAVGLISVAGCSGITEGRVCSTDMRAGIMIDVRDSVTDARVGRNARIIARAGTVADTVRESSFTDGPFGLAYEQPGTYVVTVEQAGYQTWTRSGVQVTPGECHVNAVSLIARLKR